MNDQVVYKDELEREKKALRNLDKIPIVQDDRTIRLFEILNKSFSDVKWIGRSINVASASIYIRPPYGSDNVEGEESDDMVQIKKLVNDHN